MPCGLTDARASWTLTFKLQMESLANEGKIEESSAMSKAIEQLKEQKDSLIRAQVTATTLAPSAIVSVQPALLGITRSRVSVKYSLDKLQAGEVFSIKQQEKRMKVCEICGAFLVIGDTENRVRSHLEGKQHVGYLRIREALKKFSVCKFFLCFAVTLPPPLV